MATIDQALAEVYASNPQDDFVLNTLELRHPTFVDDDGNPTAIRVVANFEPLTAMLEAGAPLNAGQMVQFEALGFDFTLPSLAEGQPPELAITLKGVSWKVIVHLENAITMTDKIEVTFRRFLAASPEAGPRDGRPMTLYASVVKATLTEVTMTADLTDIHNKAFPSNVYTPTTFPGLNRSS